MSTALLALMAAGCAPHVDPLAELRHTYAVASALPARDADAQASMRVDDAAMAELLKRYLGEPITAPGAFGMRLVILPTIEAATVTAAGDSPLVLNATLRGTTDISFPLMSSNDLRFEGTLAGPLVTEVRSDELGTWVGVRWQDPDLVRTTVNLPDAGPEMSAIAGGIVARSLQNALAESRGSRLPPTPWGHVRDVRLRGQDGDLVADLVLSPVSGGPPPDGAPPPGGWSAVASAETVLGVAQALALSQAPNGKLVVEPRRVQIDEGTALVELRIHKRSRKPKWRDYSVRSPVIFDGTTLRLPVETLTAVDNTRWRAGWRVKIGEQRALRLLQEGLADVPRSITVPLSPTRSVEFSIDDVVLIPGALEIQGGIPKPPENKP
jgi:hypothetical protein